MSGSRSVVDILNALKKVKLTIQEIKPPSLEKLEESHNASSQLPKLYAELEKIDPTHEELKSFYAAREHVLAHRSISSKWIIDGDKSSVTGENEDAVTEVMCSCSSVASLSSGSGKKTKLLKK